MKKPIFLLIALLIIGFNISAQVEMDKVKINKIYIISTHDGATFMGKIVSHDKREVLISTTELGEVSVPTYQVKQIKEANKSDIGHNGEYLKDNIFATRYFITTNGFDIKKGDHYILLNWYGPDLQYGLANNLTIGIMSSWVGSPIIGSLKYSKQISENTSFAVGALAGSMGWTAYQFGGALPFAALTIGDRKTNFTISAGYGAIWTEGLGREMSGDALMSVAGMARINNAMSLVFDSFIIPGFSQDNNFNALLIPGLRYQKKENIALQFGFAGIISEYESYDGGSTEFASFAIPMAQLFFKF